MASLKPYIALAFRITVLSLARILQELQVLYNPPGGEQARNLDDLTYRTSDIKDRVMKCGSHWH